MFTGIIEALGTITNVDQQGTNNTFWIKSAISSQLRVDQSLSHDGVCLTVEEITGDSHRVTAVQETLHKTNLGQWKPEDIINLERCLALNGRLDGHLVQGHVDCTAILIEKTNLIGSWTFSFSFPENFQELVIEKGSISVNGISLTVFNVTNNNFSIAVIPYTYELTNLQKLATGEMVNIEFDMIGKYINRHLKYRNSL
ncbi:MAG: riboflavin synthase [Chitinophagaceae bacterium]